MKTVTIAFNEKLGLVSLTGEDTKLTVNMSTVQGIEVVMQDRLIPAHIKFIYVDKDILYGFKDDEACMEAYNQIVGV